MFCLRKKKTLTGHCFAMLTFWDDCHDITESDVFLMLAKLSLTSHRDVRFSFGQASKSRANQIEIKKLEKFY